MAQLMEARGLLFCDLSDFTAYLNQLDQKELAWFAEVYEGLLKKMMELRYNNRGKYLANRMGDGFIWFDFEEDADPLSLLNFTEQTLDPLLQSFIKSVKVLANKDGLRGARYTILPGTVVYAEARIDKQTAGKTSTSRIDFLSPRINLAARINALVESEDFLVLGDQELAERVRRHRPDCCDHLVDLGRRSLKGLWEAPHVWGYKVRTSREPYYRGTGCPSES